jgi:hypothetical protein
LGWVSAVEVAGGREPAATNVTAAVVTLARRSTFADRPPQIRTNDRSFFQTVKQWLGGQHCQLSELSSANIPIVATSVDGRSDLSPFQMPSKTLAIGVTWVSMKPPDHGQSAWWWCCPVGWRSSLTASGESEDDF